MGIIAKEGSKNAIIMYFGAVLGAVNTIVLYPQILPTEEFGLVMTMTSISILIAGISAFGSTASIIKYLPFFRDKDRKTNDGLLSYLFLISLFFSIIIAVVLVVGKEYIQKPYVDNARLLVDYYYYIIPLFIIQLCLDLFNNLTLSLYKASFSMFQREVFLRVGQIFLIFLYYLGLIKLQGFVIGYILMYFASLAMTIIFIKSQGEFNFENPAIIKSTKRREIFSYGGFTFLSSIASTLVFRIDTLMIGAMVTSAVVLNQGLKAVALYGVALNIATMIEMPFRALKQGVTPAIAEAFKDNDLTKVDVVYRKSTETMLIIGGFIFVGIWSCIDQVAALLPSEYSQIKYVFLWLGVGKLINVSTGSNSQIMINSDLYKIFTLITIVGLGITIFFNYFLIIEFQTIGAALATAMTYFIINFIIWLVLLMKFNFQPFRLKSLWLVLLLLLISIVFSNFKLDNNILTIAIKAIGITVIYWFIILKFKFSEDLSSYYIKGLQKLIRR